MLLGWRRFPACVWAHWIDALLHVAFRMSDEVSRIRVKRREFNAAADIPEDMLTVPGFQGVNGPFSDFGHCTLPLFPVGDCMGFRRIQTSGILGCHCLD